MKINNGFRYIIYPASMIILFSTSCKDIGSDATKNLEQGLKEVADGLKDVDLTGMRTLIAQNENLREIIKKYETGLAPYSQKEIDLAQSLVKFSIGSCFGDFKVTVAVNTPSNVVMQKSIHQNPFHLDYDYKNVLYAEFGGKPAPILFTDANSISLNSRLRTTVDQEINMALKKNPFNPEEPSSVDLNSHLTGERTEKIIIMIIPTSGFQGDKWSFSSKVTLEKHNGSAENYTILNYESDDFPNHKLGTPLPPFTVLIRTKK